MKGPAHLALHPFGQIPTYEEGDLVLFESGAIVLHVAERHAGLLPDDPKARARAIGWMFAALNTVEPPIVVRRPPRPGARQDLARGAPAHARGARPRAARRTFPPARRRRLARRRVQRRRPADGTVLRRLNGSGMLEEYPNLAAYVARGEARPAFRRAFAAQLAVFTGKPLAARQVRSASNAIPER